MNYPVLQLLFYVLVFYSRFALDKLLFHQLKRFRHHNDIHVIVYVTGGSPQTNDSLRLRELHAVSVNMAHNIMAHLFFPCFCNSLVDVLRMSL